MGGSVTGDSLLTGVVCVWEGLRSSGGLGRHRHVIIAGVSRKPEIHKGRLVPESTGSVWQ